MDRKLDKNDFEEEMQTKSSLRDTEMVLHSLSVFYWWIFSTVQLISQQMRMDVDYDDKEPQN